MGLIWSIKAVVKWVFDKFNNKVEDKLSDVEGEASNLLFDPSKTASFNRLSHMGKMTLIFSRLTPLESFVVISSSSLSTPDYQENRDVRREQPEETA